jgi:23S rRNA (uracil1939-C5)-methyltransferase
MSDVVVTIDKLSYGGAGFGRVEGKACFVPFTAPGDRARIRVTADKRSYIEGELIELLEPSLLRAVPPCPVFGICGGCNWQHLAYPAQLASKEAIFAELLWRIARVESEHILPIIPAPEPFAYRSRIQLKVSYIAGAVHIGFFRTKSHCIVDIPVTCAIVQPEINRIIAELCQLLNNSPEPDKISQVDVSSGDDGKTIIIIHFKGSSPAQLSAFLLEHKDTQRLADGMFVQSGGNPSLIKVFGIESLSYQIAENKLSGIATGRLSFSKGGFSQVNYRQNRRLIELVWSWAELTGKEKVLDLYCGNGNFSIPLAGCAKKLVGLEGHKPSIIDAKRNSELNNLTNAVFYCADAALELKKHVAAGEDYDVVVLDPPRSGAAEVVNQIHALKPRSILYVSCDPATLARDIGILRKHNYEVVKCRPVDMFPQTYHIESVTLLRPV